MEEAGDFFYRPREKKNCERCRKTCFGFRSDNSRVNNTIFMFSFCPRQIYIPGISFFNPARYSTHADVTLLDKPPMTEARAHDHVADPAAKKNREKKAVYIKISTSQG